MTRTGKVFVTGATGLIGGQVLARLLSARPVLRAYVLVRDPARWLSHASRLGIDPARVVPVRGDLRLPGLGLDRATRDRITQRLDAVVHAAAATSFSQRIEDARGVNVAGTRRVLALASEARRPVRFAFVSTAFVAGRRTGRIAEMDGGARLGWVNAYEQSKAEAEAVVTDAAPDRVIFRPSTVVCDGPDGQVSQYNAVHRALRLCWHGRAPMLPSAPGATVDVVTADYVADAIAALALRDDVRNRTIHLCAGTASLPLDELVTICWRVWSRDEAWRRRTVEPPALATLETYRLFERSVLDTADEGLRRVVGSLSHFAPQLALPKTFDTATADALLGRAALPVRSYWPRLVEHLAATGWSARRMRRAA
jgi:thioester reductase-like protein